MVFACEKYRFQDHCHQTSLQEQLLIIYPAGIGRKKDNRLKTCIIKGIDKSLHNGRHTSETVQHQASLHPRESPEPSDRHDARGCGGVAGLAGQRGLCG